MKIYAKQRPPEYQESPLFMGEWPENVYTYGNRHYKNDGEKEIENIKNAMYDAADELKTLPCGYRNYESFIDIIADLLPAPKHKNEYSRADRLKWRALLLNFDAGAIGDDDAITAALELITGDEYDAAEIRGCCQGDWNNIIYPAKYGPEWLREFEIEYFNTGDEWHVYDDGDEYGTYVYTHGWRDDEKRAEIAAAVGCDPGDVVLYEFDGWTRTPNYREVGA